MTFETRFPGAWRALALLLGINLFNYIDRYILSAVEPTLRKELFAGDPRAMTKTGWLASAFLISYMVLAPVFGRLADRYSRWLLVGAGVALWSLASAASGLAGSFAALLITRVFVGVGESAYGPAAPALIADYFTPSSRGRVLSLFYLAIPVGSALGYVFGGLAGSAWGWRWPFLLAAVPGLVLAVCCIGAAREPRKSQEPRESAPLPLRAVLGGLCRNRPFLINTAAMAAMTFSVGGLAYWVPAYIHDFRGQPDLGRINTLFGAVTVMAGLLATCAGGWLADWLKKRRAGAYFWVSGVGMLAAFPLTVAMLFTPFPYFWGMLFAVEFCLFFNTGPANAALIEATSPAIRASAFAVNIFLIHALGDAISPPVIGAIADRWQLNAAFLGVSGMIAISGLFWIVGAKYVDSDSQAATLPHFTES